MSNETAPAVYDITAFYTKDIRGDWFGTFVVVAERLPLAEALARLTDYVHRNSGSFVSVSVSRHRPEVR